MVVSNKHYAPLDMRSNKIENVLDPASAQDAATKNYVDVKVPLTTRGDLLTRGASANSRLAIGAADTVLKSDGTDPAWGKVLPANLDVSADNTTANATSGHHGLLPKLSGSAMDVLRGDGTFGVPTGGLGSVTVTGTPAEGDIILATSSTTAIWRAMLQPVVEDLGGGAFDLVFETNGELIWE